MADVWRKERAKGAQSTTTLTHRRFSLISLRSLSYSADCLSLQLHARHAPARGAQLCSTAVCYRVCCLACLPTPGTSVRHSGFPANASPETHIPCATPCLVYDQSDQLCSPVSLRRCPSASACGDRNTHRVSARRPCYQGPPHSHPSRPSTFTYAQLRLTAFRV
ncbi:hypothetical protein BV20DRAFT_540738 [Pilatotrama ljubarskyi]|nr:hypothetical protein BV20DRAFT_540738 [Pilatotrama ljubarskyi]